MKLSKSDKLELAQYIRGEAHELAVEICRTSSPHRANGLKLRQVKYHRWANAIEAEVKSESDFDADIGKLIELQIGVQECSERLIKAVLSSSDSVQNEFDKITRREHQCKDAMISLFSANKLVGWVNTNPKSCSRGKWLVVHHDVGLLWDTYSFEFISEPDHRVYTGVNIPRLFRRELKGQVEKKELP